MLPMLLFLSEFYQIMESGKDNSLTLENLCADYERWALVQVVAGRRELLEDGERINDCPALEITSRVK